MYRNLTQKRWHIQKNQWRGKKPKSNPRNPRKNHRKQSRYNNYYFDSVYAEKWCYYLTEVEKLKEDVSSIQLSKTPTADEIADCFISLLSVITNFYDKNGFLDLVPEGKAKVAAEFYDTVESIVRREKTPVSYWITSQPGEKITRDNLYITCGEPVTDQEIKSKHIPKIFIKEYNGKKYWVEAPIKPMSEWLTGKVKTVTGYHCAISKKKLLNMISTINSEILRTCKAVISDNELLS
jgi:hypothetical protein